MQSSSSIKWAQFCGHDPNLPLFHAPFVLAGWRYATDGRICIRIRAPAAEDTLYHGAASPAMLDWSHDRVRKWVPFPKWDGTLTPGTQCGSCGGGGVCRACACKQEHQCGLCGGTGHLPDEYRTQTVGRIRLGGYYVNAINTLPGQVEIARADIYCTEIRPVRFRFGRTSQKGEGMLMPVRGV